MIGRIFWEGAVAHLMPELEELEPVLDDLLLRDFIIRENRSSITGERAYRFKHVLIRDVAYAGLAKGSRRAAPAGRRLAARGRRRGARRDQGVPPRSRRDAARGARRRRLARARCTCGRRTRRRVAVRSREANQPARRLLVRSVELEPTLQRRFLAARAARRLADLPAQAVEMERVFADATDAGDVRPQGLALTALAENACSATPTCPAASSSSRRSSCSTTRSPRTGSRRWRPAPGSAGGSATSTTTSAGTRRRSRSRARSAARISRRAPPTSSRARRSRGLDLDRATRLNAEALELADESGNITVIGWALVSQARIDALRGRLDEAAAGSRGRRSSSPSPATSGRSRASATTSAGSSAAAATSTQPTDASATRSGS